MDNAPINIEVIQLDPSQVLLLEDNAHYMKPETYRRLVENVRRDGQLTSTPFLWWSRERDGWECLSGNHRIQAAVEAELEQVVCLATRDELSKDQRLAIQLSHNALVGEDDLGKLKKLYAQIGTVDLKAYTGLVDNHFDSFKPPKIEGFSPVALSFRSITLLFLPHEVDRLEAVADKATSMLGRSDFWAARLEDYARFGDALEDVAAAYHIRNKATLVMLLIEMLERHLDELAEGWQAASPDPTHFVPIASVFGSRFIPADVARQVREVIQSMKEAGDINKRNQWQALEYMSANYWSSFQE